MKSLKSSCPLVDIGANLSHSAFSHDLDTVVQAARLAGIVHIIITGTDPETIAAGETIISRHPGFMTLTAGFHPHVAVRFDEQSAVALTHWLAQPQVVAAGEMGLDFNRNFSPPATQVDVFARQLELAAQAGKPVFLHQRDAHDAFHSILKEFRHRLSGGVVHCFTDSRQALHDYLDLDMHIGITGWICDERRGSDLQDLVRDIPLQRLMLETDAPYLLPRSIKPTPANRRNEPKFLTEVLQTVARCIGKPAAQVAAESTRNAVRLFGLHLPDPGIEA